MWIDHADHGKQGVCPVGWLPNVIEAAQALGVLQASFHLFPNVLFYSTCFNME